MITDNDLTPTGTSVPPISRKNSPNPSAMSRTGSGAGFIHPPFRIRRARQPTASEEFKAQLSYAFRYLYATLQETKAEFHIAPQSFSVGAREACALLQLMESRLARDETIVEAELREGRKALEIVEREIKKEQQQWTAEVVEGFRFQQAQRDVDVQTTEVRYRTWEKEVLALRERLETQRQEWNARSKEQNAKADRKLEEQKLAAATELKKQREEKTILFA